MNQSVLPQLQSVEAELALQESQLTQQLTSVQEKLNGLRAVMPMFLETTTTAEELPTADELAVAVPAIAEELEAADEPEPTKAKTTASKKTTQEKKTPTQKKATTKKAAAKETTAKSTTAKKDGRAATWQKYTRPGVKNESIPDAVQLILETQPENEFKIADVMAALFEEKMPRTQYLKARNRISNVLSGGVRAGDWYKGERGTYRMTEA